MKKIFILLGLTAFYLCSIAQEVNNNPGHPGRFNPAVKQYVKEHVVPVLLEKRQLVEKELTTAEKSNLATYRTQLKQLALQRKEQLQQKPAGVSMREFMQSDEQKAVAKQTRQQMKEVMQNIEVIANNHLATLDNIHSQLEPVRKQWTDDITKLRATATNTNTQNTDNRSANTQDWHQRKGGMGQGIEAKLFDGQKAYAHFLLIPAHPAASATGDNDILDGEIESILSDEPAATTASGSLKSFEVLPNPASNELVTGNGQLPGSNEFKLLDMQGRVALSLQNVQPAQHIDVSQLPSGTYLAQLTSNGQSQQNKIVISH
jgi:hypothetical protein